MNATTVVAIMLGTVLVTILIVHTKRDRAVETYERFKFTRKVSAALIAILLSWTLINTGDPLLILLAVLGLASATTYWYVERPDEDLV